MVSPKYRGRHQALRRHLLPTAYGKPCVRCGQPMLIGQSLDLDHDDDHGGYLGFSHASCNRSEGAARGNRTRNAGPRRRAPKMTKYAIGVDIAYDRQHTSIVAAGRVNGFVSVKVLARLPGADTASQVAQCIRDRAEHLIVPVIDPKSPAVTLLKPLREASIPKLYELTGADAVEAHHLFLDEFYAGRIRHDGHADLATAMQHADVRHLGGGEAIDRRRGDVDVSPLTAAQMAVFGLLRREPRPPRIWSWSAVAAPQAPTNPQ